MNNKHAVVIGGSITGLLVARVLSESFEKVTIVETDKLPLHPDARKGVPQSVQPHILLAKGYRILEELFSGIGAELTAAGALMIDWGREFQHYHRHPGHEGWSAFGFSTNIISITCSRPLLEWAIRRRLGDLPNVRFLEQHRVTGLLCNPSQTHITGVCLRSIGGGTENNLAATLVVDASGRRSQAPHWLRSLGFTPPPETVINPFLGYASRRYRMPKDFCPTWKAMVAANSPLIATRQGSLFRIENGDLIATLGGFGRDFPPTDNSGFLEFARSLPTPKIYKAIAASEPISPIFAYRDTANRLRHYEKITLPDGFIALGDAVCALCPIYGQGMTVSALSAMVLRGCLQEARSWFGGEFTSSHFQEKLAQSNFIPWTTATVQSSRFPSTKGGRKPNQIDELLHYYADRLHKMGNIDVSLQTLFLEVAHNLKSPLEIYHPLVVFRVLSTIFEDKLV